MSKFKLHFVINCICFTYIILFICILTKLGLANDLTINEIIGIFLISSTVQPLIHITDTIFTKNNFMLHLIRIVDIFIVVFPTCYFFGLFEFNIKNIIIYSVLNITLYILVCLVFLSHTQYYASSINEKINERLSRKR